MIEIMITRKNRLEPTLILQLVNDVTIIIRIRIFSYIVFFIYFMVYSRQFILIRNPRVLYKLS